MQITAANWQLLSPLLDDALQLTPAARIAWLNEQTQLTPANKAYLAQLVVLANAPETDNLFQELTGVIGAPALRPMASANARADDTIGPYRLIRLLGRGGMAEVWLARRSDGAYVRDVALKLPLAHLPHNVAVERLLRERNVLAALEHPAIARLYDAGIAANGQPFLAMEYVEGENILIHADREKLGLRARCKLMLYVLDALHYAHQHLVVHRDLKPSNIIVRSDGRVTLLDFGIAKVLESETSASLATELTQAAGSALTLAYAAPEQLLAEPVTTATDLYSAGVVMFELLTGARPFAQAERSPSALLQAIDTLAVPLRVNAHDDTNAQVHGCETVAAWQRAFHGDLAAICARALRREPVARYASALSMREDLARYFDDQPVQARAGVWSYRARKFFDRNRAALIVSAVATVSALGFGTHAWQQRQDSRLSAARATATESVVKNLFDGMNPNSNTPRTFTAKELLDKSRPLMLQAGAANADSRSKTNMMMGKLYLDVGAFAEALDLFNTEISEARAVGDVKREVWAQCLLTDAHLDMYKSRLAYDTMMGARGALAQLSDTPNILRAEVEYRLGTAALFLQQSDEAERRLKDARGMVNTSGESAVELLARIITMQAAVVRERGNLIATEKYFSEAQKLLHNRAGMQLTKDALDIEMLPVSNSLGHYTQSIAQAEQLLAQFATRATTTDNAYPLTTANYYATALMRMGRLGEATTQVEWVKANATAANSPMSFYARIIEAQINLYSGAAKIAEPRFMALLNEDAKQPNVITQGLLKRHLSHALLQQGKTTEAQALLQQVEADQMKVIPDAQSTDIAFTRILLGVALLRQGDLARANATLVSARDALRTKLEPSHYATLLVDTYLALVAAAKGQPSADAASLAERVQRELGWQHGGAELATRLKKQSPAATNAPAATDFYVPALL